MFAGSRRASRLRPVARTTGVLRNSLYEWRAAYRAMGVAGLNRKRGPKPGGAARIGGRRRPTPALAAARPPDDLVKGQGADCRARAARRTPTGGPRFFSRSLAVMGRQTPRRAARPSLRSHRKNDARGIARRTRNQARREWRICARSPDLSRASYYRWLEPNLSARDDAGLRDLIQRLALERRHEGYRRITRRLSDEGLVVNAKRVLRLMRTDNLLSLRRRPFVPPTTDSRHRFAIVPNLARCLEPTGLDQLWVADITYVRLAEGFVYLAVVIDAFSRKVVGWALDDHLEARLAVQAIDMAIAARDPPPGLIHHSDRGVQYASSEYAARLDARGIQRSMSRPGNPYDNAKAESFMKTLKAEEADGKSYVDLDARAPRHRRLHRRRLQRRPPPLRPRLQIAACLRGNRRRAENQNRENLTALSPN